MRLKIAVQLIAGSFWVFLVGVVLTGYGTLTLFAPSLNPPELGIAWYCWVILGLLFIIAGILWQASNRIAELESATWSNINFEPWCPELIPGVVGGIKITNGKETDLVDCEVELISVHPERNKPFLGEPIKDITETMHKDSLLPSPFHWVKDRKEIGNKNSIARGKEGYVQILREVNFDVEEIKFSNPPSDTVPFASKIKTVGFQLIGHLHDKTRLKIRISGYVIGKPLPTEIRYVSIEREADKYLVTEIADE